MNVVVVARGTPHGRESEEAVLAASRQQSSRSLTRRALAMPARGVQNWRRGGRGGALEARSTQKVPSFHPQVLRDPATSAPRDSMQGNYAAYAARQQELERTKMSCLVIDAALKDGGSPQTVTLDDATATLGELRRLIRRLPDLPSSAGLFHVCHDGNLLQDDEASLASLGVIDCPVVVILAAKGPEGKRTAVSRPSVSAGATTAAANAHSAPSTTAASPAARPSSTAAFSAAPPPSSAPPTATAALTQAASVAREVPEDAVCRICFSDGGRLISPCMCVPASYP